MASSAFLTDLSGRIKEYQSSYNLTSGKAFMAWYAIEGLDLTEEAALEAVSYDGGNDKGLDLFYVDEQTERVILAQGKYQAKGQYKANVGEFLKLVHTTDWLKNPESLHREGRPDLAAAALEYNEAVAKGYSMEYHYLYLGPQHKEVSDAAANFNDNELSNVPARHSRVLHFDLLEQIHADYLNPDNRIGTEVVQLDPASVFQQSGNFGRALVASISGTELRKLYRTHGMRLFDRNVRLFLGARKGTVNAGIRQTLGDPVERRNFWAYNNGLTFICGRYFFDDASGQLTIENFSVVNGCQTTVSVAESPDIQPDEVTVLARFITAAQEPVVDNIITYTNSQTPIRQWDISSQNPIQRRLKQEFAEEPYPFFYEDSPWRTWLAHQRRAKAVHQERQASGHTT